MSEDEARIVVLADWDEDEVERVLTNGVTVCIGRALRPPSAR
jgi:hypothetical protein